MIKLLDFSSLRINRGVFCVGLLCLASCAEDPFREEDLDDLPYPALNSLRIPTDRAQPHAVFGSAKAIEKDLETQRRRGAELHKELQQKAVEQKTAQTPLERALP